MNISKEVIQEYNVINVEGFIDASNSSELEESIRNLIEKGSDKIILNLEKVTYMSSSGLRVFLMGSKELQAIEGQFRVCNANEVVMEILTISGFNMIVDIRDSLEEALA
ncbi:anti-sigma factor antagonist [Flammeovirga yaeyamensis]|uniref:Anti-sigma factor antagonist n=1 Tax=Flammeovirga yaeyamensis TaxID=367791 RepID=A0AAX1NBR1_9BACT|nr:STAS domain-containing protein [Flammeovirga yaeyamensis]MBB3697121.1 anti-sigma B factor antagonist [Flammeovirga yaeyamensis]NMF33784.1 STAS domain-containing protein [Flammeovirga yaeyamensis]QWG04951.1 anti-sigma factor antagonist [Flammeovirga yaeyamensis]